METDRARNVLRGNKRDCEVQCGRVQGTPVLDAVTPCCAGGGWDVMYFLTN